MTTRVSQLDSGLARRQVSDEGVSFCNWVLGAAIVVDRKLYYEGGLENTPEGFKPNDSGVTVVDLTKGLRFNDAEKKQAKKPRSIPTLTHSTFWSNGKTIFRFGGAAPLRSSPPEVLMHSFDIETFQWSELSMVDDTRRVHGGSTQSESLAFYLGGQANDRTTPGMKTAQAYNDMLIFDMENQTFERVDGSPLGDAHVFSGLEYVDYGKEGALIALGGQNIDGFVSFKKVGVYDIAGKRWYTQQTTGEIPSARIGFCTLKKDAPDRSSTQIFVYGGWDGNLSSLDGQYDTMHVLNLPSFKFKKVHEGSYSIYDMKCVGYESLMLSVGQNEREVPETCHEDSEQIGIFNIGTLKWGTRENMELRKYSVHPKILDSISGLDEPADGWDSIELAEMFGTRPGGSSSTIRKTTAATSDSSGSRTNTSDPQSPESSAGSSSTLGTGAIAGIAAGGAVVLIVLVAFMINRLRKRKAPRKGAPATYGSKGHSPGQSQTRLTHELDRTHSSKKSYRNEVKGPIPYVHTSGPFQQTTELPTDLQSYEVDSRPVQEMDAAYSGVYEMGVFPSPRTRPAAYAELGNTEVNHIPKDSRWSWRR